ncbi:MAG: hypothetical protein LBN30_04800 [Oscillospiraceae bacterium]|nr:hypothetical protein [Oscillospiraceae bacterium]
MKVSKLILALVGAVLAIAAAVSLIVVFHAEIAAYIQNIKDKALLKKDTILHADEFTDYADV